jgi:hypothetical protein
MASPIVTFSILTLNVVETSIITISKAEIQPATYVDLKHFFQANRYQLINNCKNTSDNNGNVIQIAKHSLKDTHLTAALSLTLKF